MNKVVLKANASFSEGYGHVYRLLALYKILENYFDCSFISGVLPNAIRRTLIEKKLSFFEFENENLEIEFISKNRGAIVVLDGYNFTSNYFEKIKHHNCKIIKVDDFYECNPIFDGIINHSPLAQLGDYVRPFVHQNFALGADYVLLRKAFLKAARKRNNEIQGITKVFVCFGGTDPKNISSIVLEELLKNSVINEIHIISDKLLYNESDSNVKIFTYKNLDEYEIIDLLRKSHLTICPPSTISLEACAVGTPLIVIPVVDNQIEIGKGLSTKKAAYLLEFAHLNKLNSVINSLKSSDLEDIKYYQSQLIDGKSSDRLIEFFRKF
ncbi:PseG/SpsG family protein [Mongoliibacter ruber]|uniref:Spore coat polysaccharide biosynthesis predicted glycosyltransferase SpsG n=1 Tax=Mongoliibacter ruber TaxID=1750599 RepID=A0A2T0WG30_9BACT|nr:hypothetical protein [Mongoliibacter ruber]PRY85670.1 spore coat polysaccharide biosynthesis predicted glycosyltransferase SpsG [Mongoliibacter ruber]